MIERRPDQTPVRVVEAEWENDRLRYVNALQSMSPVAHISFLMAYVQIAMKASDSKWPPVVLFGSFIAGYHVWRAVRRPRAYRYVRAQYRPPDPARAVEFGMVQARFLVGDQEFAADVGFLTLDDGAITFEGGQVSFSLAPSRWSGWVSEKSARWWAPFVVKRPALPPNEWAYPPVVVENLTLTSTDWPGRSLELKPIPRHRALRDLELPAGNALGRAYEAIAATEGTVEISQTPPRRSPPDRYRAARVRWRVTGGAVFSALTVIAARIASHLADPISWPTCFAFAFGAGALICFLQVISDRAIDKALRALERDP